VTRRNIDISDELWQALKIEAAIQGITIKALVARLLAKEVKAKK
jgi:predicted DNA binding CopG/RHH family protein